MPLVHIQDNPTFVGAFGRSSTRRHGAPSFTASSVKLKRRASTVLRPSHSTATTASVKWKSLLSKEKKMLNVSEIGT